MCIRDRDKGLGGRADAVGDIAPNRRRDDADGGKRSHDGAYLGAGKPAALQEQGVVAQRRHGGPIHEDERGKPDKHSSALRLSLFKTVGLLQDETLP